MVWRAGKLGWLGILAGWLAGVGATSAQTPKAVAEPTPAVKSVTTLSFAPSRVAFEDIPAAQRDKVRALMEKATLTARGPTEVFTCQPACYFWLLDNPDQGVRLWRLLNAKCTDIEREPTTGFCWHDDQGSRLHWDAVLHTAQQHVWYAEGKVNPGVLLPTVDVQAVVVLTHAEGTDSAGKPAIRHHLELYLKTDGRAISMATKMIGASSPRLAEQYLGQMQLFFAALAWYLDQHPQKAAELALELEHPKTTSSPNKKN